MNGMLFPEFNELMGYGSGKGKSARYWRRKAVSVHAGDYISSFRGRGLEFEEVRAYVPGDDVRNIDWRVTARKDAPYVKLFSEERERSVIVCIDNNDAMRFGTRGTFKSVQAARVASIVGWDALYAGDRIGASFFGNVPGGMKFFGARRSRRSLWRMFGLLCDQEDYFSEPVGMDTHLLALSRATSPGALFFVISDFLDPGTDIKKSLSILRRKGDVVLLSVNDPADMSMPDAGSIYFRGEAGGKLLVNTGDKGGRDTYARQWEENRRTMGDICKVLGIGFVQLYTNSADIRADVASGMRRIGRRMIRHERAVRESA